MRIYEKEQYWVEDQELLDYTEKVLNLQNVDYEMYKMLYEELCSFHREKLNTSNLVCTTVLDGIVWVLTFYKTREQGDFIPVLWDAENKKHYIEIE